MALSIPTCKCKTCIQIECYVSRTDILFLYATPPYGKTFYIYGCYIHQHKIETLIHKHSLKSTTYQIARQVYKVSIIFVDELYHGISQNLEVHIEVISEVFQLNSSTTFHHELINVKVQLKTKKYQNL